MTLAVERDVKPQLCQRKEKKCNLFIYLMNPDNSNVKKKKIKKKKKTVAPSH